MFNVGDTVALTGSSLMALSQQHPEVFKTLQATARVGGRVIDILKTDDPEWVQVAIEIGPDSKPILLDVSTKRPELDVQVIQTPTMLMPPAEDTDDDDDEVSMQMFTIGPDGTSVPVAPQDVPAPVLSAMQSVFGQSQGPARPSRSAMPPIVPQTVQLSQWVMTQFIGLKQYVIIQDLNREPDIAKEDVLPGDEWKLNGQETARRVQIKLTETEESLYGAALKKLQNWIEEGDKVPQPTDTQLPDFSVSLPELPPSPATEFAADIAEEPITEPAESVSELPASSTVAEGLPEASDDDDDDVDGAAVPAST